MSSIHPHHDGSELYVSNEAPKLGENIELRVRVPHAFAKSEGLSKILARMYVDGEPRTFELKKSQKKSKVETWWSVKVLVNNPELKYRFLLVGPKSYHWLTAAGLVDSNPTSNTDFRITARPAFPKWLRGAVFYQIFPDRFATSGKKRDLPEWAIPRQWDLLPHGEGKTTSFEYYGGDFSGIESKIDHITKLGATGIYFTPFFPARSIHRYDASSFDHVDPLLGGDKEFTSFVKRAHKLGLKILGDLTTNHTGAGHAWLAKGLKDKSAKERGFYYFDKKIKHGYVGWWDLPSLPKLNFKSSILRKVFYESENSIVRKWLRTPKSLDGWRIDVGNMTGRFKEEDMQREVMRGIRLAMDETNPNAWLVAENADWQSEDLDGFGWHGTMNYEGFMRPLWAWLGTGEKIGRGFHGMPIDPPTFTGKQFVDSTIAIKAAIPWRSLMASMTLLDSHDTARFRTVVGKRFDRHLAGMTLLMTYPGVPSIFAGDEIGLEGAWGEDARRSMPWGQPDKWDHDFFNETRALISIRKSSDALVNGGLRFVKVENEYFAFLRESGKQSLLVVVWRDKCKIQVDLKQLGVTVKTSLYEFGVGQAPSIDGTSLISFNPKHAGAAIFEVR